MKYVIIDNKTPILFGAEKFHVEFDDKDFGEITSAGFVLLEHLNKKLKVKTYGISSSLNIGPSSHDSKIIYNHLVNEDPGKNK